MIQVLPLKSVHPVGIQFRYLTVAAGVIKEIFMEEVAFLGGT